jgi:hypothetical protein
VLEINPRFAHGGILSCPSARAPRHDSLCVIFCFRGLRNPRPELNGATTSSSSAMRPWTAPHRPVMVR